VFRHIHISRDTDRNFLFLGRFINRCVRGLVLSYLVPCYVPSPTYVALQSQATQNPKLDILINPPLPTHQPTPTLPCKFDLSLVSLSSSSHNHLRTQSRCQWPVTTVSSCVWRAAWDLPRTPGHDEIGKEPATTRKLTARGAATCYTSPPPEEVEKHLLAPNHYNVA
jgi:hypothetical protein